MSGAVNTCNFVVGQKVVCIQDEFPTLLNFEGHSLLVRVPMLNEILTVSGFGTPRDDQIYLFFSEIDEWQRDGRLVARVSWLHLCFRPLEIRKTDISQFQKLLLSAPAKEFV